MFDQMLKRMHSVTRVGETKMEEMIGLWSDLYRNDAPWLDRSVHSLNLPAVIAAELARLSTMEFSCKVSGGKRAEFLSRQCRPVLRKLREIAESACAKGGFLLKPYVNGREITVDLIGADRFLPISFDASGRMTGAIFADCLTQGKAEYLRLEQHELEDGVYRIRNYAYEKHGNDWKEIPLASVPRWKTLAKTMTVKNLTKPLFAYLKLPGVNTAEETSPLGVSVYHRAVDLIEQADRQYSRMLWEFEGGELAIDACADALRYDERGRAGLPALNRRLFRGLELDGGDRDLYQVFSPKLREESIINGLTEILTHIEDACGLARGTLSHPEAEVRTATELKMMRQRSYTTVREIQKALAAALEDLLEAMDAWTEVYQLAPRDGWEVSFGFDDSVLTDKSEEFAEKKALLDAGVMLPWEFRMWYFGESEQEAKTKLKGVRTDETGISGAVGAG